MAAEREGDGFLELFLLHRERLEAFLFHRVGCRAAAADLAQDVFLRLWRRPIERPSEAVGYLFRSARNLAVDHLRAARSREANDSALLPEQRTASAPTPEAAAIARGELGAIDAALAALPARTRRVFLLNKAHGVSYGEIAHALGVSVSTVEKDMMRALAACKAAVDRDG